MKLIYLEMEAFGPFLHKQTINFEDLNTKGMFLINGPTGSGKTSIFDAVTYALYGQGSGHDREDAKGLRSDFATDDIPTTVKLIFEANGERFTVIRKPSYTKAGRKSDISAFAELYLPNSTTVISGPSNVDKYIEENILFMSRKQFKSVALLAQGEFTDLIDAKSNDRATILEHIFDKGIYKAFLEKLDTVTKEAYATTQQITASLTTLLNQVDDKELISGYKESIEDPSFVPTFVNNIKEYIEKLEVELDEVAKDVKTKEEIHTKASNTLSNVRTQNIQVKNYLNAKTELADLESKRDMFDTLRLNEEIYEEYKALEPITKELNSSKARIHGFIVKIDNARAELKKLEPKEKYLNDNIENYNNDKIKLELVKEAITVLNDIIKEVNSLKQLKIRYEEQDKAFNQVYEHFKKVENEYKEVRERFYASSSYNLAKELKEGEPCPVCGSITHPHLAESTNPVSQVEFEKQEKLLKEEDKKVKEANEKLSSIKNLFEETKNKLLDKIHELGFNDINSDNLFSSALNNKLVEKKTIKQELENFILDYEKTQNSVAIDKSKYTNEIKTNTDSLKEEEGKLVVIQKELDEKLASNKHIKNLDKFNECKANNIKSNKDTIKKYDDEVLKCQTIISKTPEELKNIEVLDETELAEKEKDVKANLDEAIKKKGENDAKIKSLKGIVKDIEDKYNVCKDAIERYSSLLNLNNTAKGSNKSKISFRMYVLASLFEKIVASANLRLERITNSRFHLKRRTEVKGGGVQGLELDVFDSETGKVRAASSLSGGEKFVSALSLALGLSDIIETNHSLIQVESIFIDEGFGSLDGQYLDMAMDALETLKNDNKTVAIISHVERLKEYISDGIEVRKASDNIGSEIIIKNR